MGREMQVTLLLSIKLTAMVETPVRAVAEMIAGRWGTVAINLMFSSPGLQNANTVSLSFCKNPVVMFIEDVTTMRYGFIVSPRDATSMTGNV